MARAYFGSRISANIIETPEGYLVCKNVPIARTGVQKYRGLEFGGEHSNEMYDVVRPKDEVFSKAAVASFEGKPVVDDHPEEDVTPENFGHYLKGICRDVRMGEGEYGNCLVGDLIIYDKALIDKIKNGKREISCGYDCLWCQTGEFSYEQREIRGNHIAVVDKGRAGHKVAIRDSAERSKNMSKSILARMLSVFAKDADTTPDDLLEASKAVNAEEPPATPPPAREEKPTRDEVLEDRLRKIEDALAALAKPAHEEEEEEAEVDALDSLEEELGKADIDDEDVVEEDAEVINEEATDEEAEEEKLCISKSARDDALEAIKALRPVVAQLAPAQRKKAADSLATLIRGQVTADAQYGALIAATTARKAKDAAVSDEEYGRLIRDKYNPHYKKD